MIEKGYLMPLLRHRQSTIRLHVFNSQEHTTTHIRYHRVRESSKKKSGGKKRIESERREIEIEHTAVCCVKSIYNTHTGSHCARC